MSKSLESVSRSESGRPRPPSAWQISGWQWAGIAVFYLAFMWAYWTTLRRLMRIWTEQPDYSHGFLVIPLAVFFLWLRRDRRPAAAVPAWGSGLALIGVSVLIRYVGLRYSFDSFDGYSLVVWVAGLVLLVGGWRYVMWAAPSILFLLFMVPLPFQVEHKLSVPLQQVATAVSCFMLQCLGQPAFAEKTTIMLGPHQLMVEQACSGLRMFVGAFALAFAYLIAIRREVWEQVLLLASVIPIAVLANSLRIVATGLAYQYYDADVVQKLSHDLAGMFMIPLAAAMFGMVLWYLSRLVQRTEVMGMDELVGQPEA